MTVLFFLLFVIIERMERRSLKLFVEPVAIADSSYHLFCSALCASLLMNASLPLGQLPLSLNTLSSTLSCSQVVLLTSSYYGSLVVPLFLFDYY